jgi:hypothetical protein
MGKSSTDRERMEYLKKAIADLKGRLPRHSVPPSMIVELEDLQEELERLEAKHAASAMGSDTE